jgi:hypothetical protein
MVDRWGLCTRAVIATALECTALTQHSTDTATTALCSLLVLTLYTYFQRCSSLNDTDTVNKYKQSSLEACLEYDGVVSICVH